MRRVEHHPTGVERPVSIRWQLTGGDPRTLHNVAAVVQLVLDQPARVEELTGLVLDHRDNIVRMRAADALEKVGRARPELLVPHLTTILDTMSQLDQPSVQWHVAQILGCVPLTTRQRTRATRILRSYLDRSSDWIVLNCSLDSLAILARHDPALVAPLLKYLHAYQTSRHKSLSNRSNKLLAEFD